MGGNFGLSVGAAVTLVVAALAAVGVSGDYVPRLVRDQPATVATVMWIALAGAVLIAAAVALASAELNEAYSWVPSVVGFVGAFVVLGSAFWAVDLGTDSISDREQPRAVLSAATVGDVVTVSVDAHGSSLTLSETMLVQVIGLKHVSNTLSGNDGLCTVSRLGDNLNPNTGTLLAWERLGADSKGDASGVVKVEIARDEFQGVCAFGALTDRPNVNEATSNNARWTVAYLRL